MPPAATESKYGKISRSQILTTPHPQGHVMSVRCEQPLDELTVQVWLLYDHPNFKYCTLYISGTELRTDKRTDGQTDDQNTRCPRRTFQAGGIKTKHTAFTDPPLGRCPIIMTMSVRPFVCLSRKLQHLQLLLHQLRGRAYIFGIRDPCDKGLSAGTKLFTIHVV